MSGVNTDLRAQIATLAPFTEFAPEIQDKIARQAVVRAFDKGQRLKGDDHRHEYLYLLAGRVAIMPQQPPRLIGQADAASRRPLLGDREHALEVVVVEPAQILSVDRRYVASITSPRHGQTHDVEHVELDDDEAALLFELYEKISRREIELPQLPEAALAVRKALERADVSIADVAKVVARDVSSTTRLLAVVNSATFAGAAPVTRVQDAIARLGLAKTLQVMTGLAVQGLFIQRQHPYRSLMERLWHACARVSAVAATLARRQADGTDVDSALLAGLLHRVGALPILGELAQRLRRDPQRPAPNPARLLAKLEGDVADMVLQNWSISPPVARAARAALHPEPSASSTLEQILQVARVAAGGAPGTPPLETLDAVHRLGLHVEDGRIVELVAHLAELESLKASLL